MKKNCIITLIALIALIIPAIVTAQVSVMKVKITPKSQFQSPKGTCQDQVPYKGFLIVDYDIQKPVTKKYKINSISYIECTINNEGNIFYAVNQYETGFSYIVDGQKEGQIAMGIAGYYGDEYVKTTTPEKTKDDLSAVCITLVLLKGNINEKGYIQIYKDMSIILVLMIYINQVKP